VIVMARLHVFIVTNRRILIETFTGTIVRATLGPGRVAAGVNAYDRHPMQLLEKKLVNPALRPAFLRPDGRSTFRWLPFRRSGNDRSDAARSTNSVRRNTPPS
jgi:hypothetical protein